MITDHKQIRLFWSIKRGVILSLEILFMITPLWFFPLFFAFRSNFPSNSKGYFVRNLLLVKFWQVLKAFAGSHCKKHDAVVSSAVWNSQSLLLQCTELFKKNFISHVISIRNLHNIQNTRQQWVRYVGMEPIYQIPAKPAAACEQMNRLLKPFIFFMAEIIFAKISR